MNSDTPSTIVQERDLLRCIAVGPFISVAADPSAIETNALTTFVMYWVFRWSHMRGYSLAV